MSYKAAVARNTNSTDGGGHPTNRWAELALAVRFFTRLPAPAYPNGTTLAEAIWAAPLVGAVVGGIGAVVAAIVLWLGVPGFVAGIFGLAAMTVVTGALHEDGLADCADGLAGPDKARRLEIMRDSHIGVYGTLALILVVAAKIGGLGGLAFHDPGQGKALIAAGALSRATLVLVPHLAAAARDDGLGASFAAPAPAMTAVALLLGLVIAGVALAPAGPGAIAAAALVGLASALATTVLARRAFGGYTGDVLGAVQQMAELAVILTVSSLAFGATI